MSAPEAPSYKLNYAYDYDHCVHPARRLRGFAKLVASAPAGGRRLCEEDTFEKLLSKTDARCVNKKRTR